MRKLLPIILVFCLMTALFVGCGRDSRSGAATAGAPYGTTERPITVRFLKITDPLEALAFADMIPEFHRIEGGRYANINIEFDVRPFAELFRAITQAVATNSDVDMAQVDGPNMRHYAFHGVTRDLTDHFTAEELRTWAPQSVEEGSYAGRFYGPPMAQAAQILWYNVDMFREAGISTTDTASWRYGPGGNALTNYQRLTIDVDGDGTPEVYGINTAVPMDWNYGLWSRSAGARGSNTFKAVADDGITFTGYFDTPEAIAVYQFFQDMVYEHRVMASQAISQQMFLGLAATIVNQDMILGTQKDMFPDFNMGGMEPPYFVTPVSYTGSWHYAILNSTRNFDATLAFIKFASSDAGARHMWNHKNQFPANVNLFNSIDEFVDPSHPRHLVLQFFQRAGITRIQTPAYTEFNALFTDFWTSLMAGERDVAALARSTAAEMTQVAQQYRGWND